MLMMQMRTKLSALVAVQLSVSNTFLSKLLYFDKMDAACCSLYSYDVSLHFE